MLQPYRQGALDALCGVYAVTNAVALMARDLGRLNGASRRALFATLIDELDRRGLLAGAIRHGLVTPQLSMLVRIAARELGTRYRLRLEARKPMHRRRDASATEIMDRLAAHLARPATAVVVGTIEHDSHWTVIREVRSSGFTLHDSNGRASMPLASAVFASDRTEGSVRAVPPWTMFFLRLTDTAR